MMTFAIFTHEKTELENLPEDFEAALLPWVKNGVLMHIWHDNIDDFSAFAVVAFGNHIKFIRAFRIGDKIGVSVDQEVNLSIK